MDPLGTGGLRELFVHNQRMGRIFAFAEKMGFFPRKIHGGGIHRFRVQFVYAERSVRQNK